MKVASPRFIPGGNGPPGRGQERALELLARAQAPDQLWKRAGGCLAQEVGHQRVALGIGHGGSLPVAREAIRQLLQGSQAPRLQVIREQLPRGPFETAASVLRVAFIKPSRDARAAHRLREKQVGHLMRNHLVEIGERAAPIDVRHRPLPGCDAHDHLPASRPHSLCERLVCRVKNHRELLARFPLQLGCDPTGGGRGRAGRAPRHALVTCLIEEFETWLAEDQPRFRGIAGSGLRNAGQACGKEKEAGTPATAESKDLANKKAQATGR